MINSDKHFDATLQVISDKLKIEDKKQRPYHVTPPTSKEVLNYINPNLLPKTPSPKRRN